MSMFFIAEGQLEGLIWLVVIVMWGVGQLVNAMKKSQRRQNQQRPVRKTTGDQEQKGPSNLQEFLESLSQQGGPAATPPPQPPQAAKPEAVQKTVPKRSTRKRSSEPSLLRAAMDKNDLEREIGKRGSESYYKTTKISAGIKSYKLPSIKLPSASTSVMAGNGRKPPRIDFKLRNDKAFKRAILYRDILGPPKALQGDPAQCKF